MWATNLADVVRAAGLAVVETPGWKTRGRRELTGVRGVIWHHTATPASATGDYPSLKVVTSGRPDLGGPLCNLGLARSGLVYVVAAGWANHAGAADSPGRWPFHGNTDCLGIEMESPGDGTWTKEQLQVMPRLRDALSAGYRLGLSRHIAHREWAPSRKPDPVGVEIRDLLAVHTTGKTGGAGKPRTAPPPVVPAPTAAPPFPLPAGWYFGPRSGPKESVSGYFSHNADLRKWQERMRARGWSVAVNGYYDAPTARAAGLFQKERRLRVDNLIGSQTWAAAWTTKVS